MAKRTGAGGRRRGSLSRQLVLTTALGLVDREGLSALSMRRLAAELGVEAMALYRYASGKDALLDGLVEALYSELQETLDAGTAEADWRAELHRTVSETYRIALRHPHVVPLLATRMLAVPLSSRPPAVLLAQERILALLKQAGLDDYRLQMTYRAVSAWVLGYVFGELQAMAVNNPDEPEPAIRLGLHRMPAQDFPRLRAAAPALAERAGEEGLAAGLDVLLDRFSDQKGMTAG